MALMGAYSQNDYLTRDELRRLPTPEPLGNWHQPVNFGEFVDLIEDELRLAGLSVANEEHYTLAKGQRHFGVMTVSNGHQELGGEGWRMMIGIKGSHDRRVSRGLVAGRHVGVCSNGMFSGDLAKLMTKQTLHIWERLREFVRRAVEKIYRAHLDEVVRVERMQNHYMGMEDGDRLLAKLFRADVLTAQQLGVALLEWDEPSFEAHMEAGRNVWLLEQAVTQAMKPTGSRPVSMLTLENRTRQATEIIEGEFSLAA